ncbi:MAG: outer membrane protein assembly factor BamD [Endozoicomonadaceae bacterium]|nr:outer membrane protein assembly factor BamD [Endozoicomonadaceae bacterium]
MLLSKQFFTLILVTFLVACASSKKEDVSEKLTEIELYRQSQQALDQSNYHQAIDKLRALESHYPFGPFAEQAQSDLVFAYYKNMEPEAARASAERFIRLHPQHPNVDYSYYMRGLASNTADLGLIERYIPVDMSKRDPGQARQSFNEFSELLQRYPNSPYANDARQRMIALRNRLSYYELHTANYYMKRKAYTAAINRGRYIVEHMPGTPTVEEALGIMVEGYQHLNLKQPSNEALEVLKKNFPDSQLINKEGQFIGYKVYADVDPSIWNIITFGLIDGK